MKYQTIRDVDVKDKVVLVRVDYNVPIEDGKIVDDLRIRASLLTLRYLREAGAKKIILISHMGRPEGKDETLSLKEIAEALGRMLPGVGFAPEMSGENAKKIVDGVKSGGILLMENLRFSPDEEKNSEGFIKDIIDTTGAEIYVQDGFAVIHRAHASVAAVAKFLPVYMGLLLEKEVENLEKVAMNPERPMLMIIGGSKVEDKAPLIEKFLKKADKIAVGGKIAADGYKVEGNEKIYIAEDFDENADGEKLDIGPLSTAKIAGLITDAKTIVWNGLLGKAEDPAYATASTIIAEVIGEKTNAETVICGGDTTGFVENLMKDHPNLKYSLVSTGGGAALEFLLGKELPGLEVIKKA